MIGRSATRVIRRSRPDLYLFTGLTSVGVSLSLDRIIPKQVPKCQCKFGGGQFGATSALNYTSEESIRTPLKCVSVSSGEIDL